MIEKVNILLVDDDPVFHFINTRILQQMGLTKIDVALNGKEALEKLEDGDINPNAIFLDLNMPVLDGFGFIEAFQKSSISQKIKIGIAIVTSSRSPGDKQRAAELGIAHYLEKPLSEKSILPILQSLVP